MGKCIFNNEWLTNENYCSWIARVPGDKYSFRCRICKKNWKPRQHGENALKLHAAGQNHQKAAESFKSSASITSFGVYTIGDLTIVSTKNVNNNIRPEARPDYQVKSLVDTILIKK